jgi:hypothetical protein
MLAFFPRSKPAATMMTEPPHTDTITALLLICGPDELERSLDRRDQIDSSFSARHIAATVIEWLVETVTPIDNRTGSLDTDRKRMS